MPGQTRHAHTLRKTYMLVSLNITRRWDNLVPRTIVQCNIGPSTTDKPYSPILNQIIHKCSKKQNLKPIT